MSGIQEILLLIVFVLAVLILPRVFSRGNSAEGVYPALKHARPVVFTGRMRLAVVLSVLWPLAMALYLTPWDGEVLRFICIGLAPVLIGWCAWWVKRGFRRYRR